MSVLVSVVCHSINLAAVMQAQAQAQAQMQPPDAVSSSVI